MDIQLEAISPQIASDLMVNNALNRKINPNHIKFLSDQMISDAWQITGDPIKIGCSGRILDGQHRLSAIIKSGKTISLFVARNVPEEVFTVLDTGKVRSASDTLSIAGMKSYSAQAALAKAIMSLRDKKIANKNRAYTNNEVLDFCQENDLIPSVNIGVIYASKGAPLKAGVISIIHYVLNEINKQEATDFIESICLGVNISKGSAEYMLREKLNKSIQGRYDFSRWETVALVIKTWNLIRTKSTLPSMIIYNPEKEEFPKAV